MMKGLRESAFFGPVLTIMSGSTLAQLLPLITEPILVRLFSPLEFGILALFLAVATLFSAVATGRYELAIVLPNTDKKAVNILALAMTIAIFMSILSFLVVLIFGDQLSKMLNSPELRPFLNWVPLFVLVSGIFQSFNQWATRKKYYKNIAFSKISQSSSNAAVSLSTGWAGMNALGLIWGQITGWFIGSTPLIFRFFKKDRALIKQVSRLEMKTQAKIYSDFPKINSAHILSDIGQQSLVNFIIARFFSAPILGFYSRMIRIVKVPAGFIGTAVGQVFYQQASEKWQKDQDIRELFVGQLKMMLFLGLPIFGILAIWGPEIFDFVLGKDWGIAGKFAQILSPWLFLNFLISPFTQIPLIVNRQRHFFLISLIMNLVVVLSFVGGYLINEEIETSLIIISTAQSVFHLYLISWFYKLSRKKS